jgi:hypothetical protein
MNCWNKLDNTIWHNQSGTICPCNYPNNLRGLTIGFRHSIWSWIWLWHATFIDHDEAKWSKTSNSQQCREKLCQGWSCSDFVRDSHSGVMVFMNHVDYLGDFRWGGCHCFAVGSFEIEIVTRRPSVKDSSAGLFD